MNIDRSFEIEKVIKEVCECLERSDLSIHVVDSSSDLIVIVSGILDNRGRNRLTD